MSLSPRLVERASLRVRVGGGQGNQIVIEGVLREVDVGVWLTPLIDEVHQEAVAQALGEVVLDLRPLEYANASVWRCLVLWVRQIRRDPEARYNLRLLSEPKHRWQGIGISALRAFGADRLIVA